MSEYYSLIHHTQQLGDISPVVCSGVLMYHYTYCPLMSEYFSLIRHTQQLGDNSPVVFSDVLMYPQYIFIVQ